jgi:hypothetical protein
VKCAKPSPLDFGDHLRKLKHHGHHLPFQPVGFPANRRWHPALVSVVPGRSAARRPWQVMVPLPDLLQKNRFIHTDSLCQLLDPKRSGHRVADGQHGRFQIIDDVDLSVDTQSMFRRQPIPP